MERMFHVKHSLLYIIFNTIYMFHVKHVSLYLVIEKRETFKKYQRETFLLILFIL